MLELILILGEEEILGDDDLLDEMEDEILGEEEMLGDEETEDEGDDF